MQRYKHTNQSIDPKGEIFENRHTWRAGRSAVIWAGGPMRMSLWMGCAPWEMRPGSYNFVYVCMYVCVCVSWVQASLMPPPHPPAPCGVHYLYIRIHLSPNQKTHRRHLRHGLVLRGDRRDGGVHLLAEYAVVAILWCMYRQRDERLVLIARRMHVNLYNCTHIIYTKHRPHSFTSQT